jgi:hypothetical protein
MVSMESDEAVSDSRDSEASQSGSEEEWDTQYCRCLQDELLSVRLANLDEASPVVNPCKAHTDKHPEQPEKFPDRVANPRKLRQDQPQHRESQQGCRGDRCNHP